MTYSPPDSLQSFVPTTLILPDPSVDDDFNVVLSDYLKRTVAAVNDKEIGQYLQTEIISGQKFFNDEDTKNAHTVFRKAINFGALPNATTKSFPHQIAVSPSTRFTRIYATSNSPSSYIPIPFSHPTAANAIALEVSSTNVVITTGIDYSEYTETFVILEYYQS